MTHYDGPAFYRKYRLPKNKRKLNAAAASPEAAPIKRTYHLPSEGDSQTHRIRHTETRQTRPSTQAQTQLPPRETDVEMRREVDVPKPSTTMTSTNDWRTDRPFQVTSVPKQLHRPALAKRHPNFKHLIATFFKKQDDQVLLFGSSETTPELASTDIDATAPDRLHFERDTSTATTADASTVASTEAAASTIASIETDVPVTIHDWHAEVATNAASQTVKQDSQDSQHIHPVGPTAVEAAQKTTTSAKDLAAQGVVSSPATADNGDKQRQFSEIEDACATSETPLTEPVSAQETQSHELTSQRPAISETNDTKDSSAGSQVATHDSHSQPAVDQTAEKSTPELQKTLDQTRNLATIDGEESLSAATPSQHTWTDSVATTTETARLTNIPTTESAGHAIDITPNNVPVLQQSSSDKDDHGLNGADDVDLKPLSPAAGSETAGLKHTSADADDSDLAHTPLSNSKPDKPVETQHGLGHSLGDILNEENAQLNDLALFQDKPDVQRDDEGQSRGYHFPSPDLLTPPVIPDESELDEWIEHQGEVLDETLAAFHVDAHVVDWTIGPTVTQFQVHLSLGVKVNKITNLTDDLKLALAAKDIRIEAPIPGKTTVGIEIPNPKTRPVMLSEVLESEAFKTSKSPLTVALGVDLFGKPQVTDLRKMPHGLIAGATGSGKSVFINSLLISLLYKATPAELRLLLIDPKAVELALYDKLPHLLAPVISDPQAAAAALKWAVNEMDDRYDRLAAAGVRNIEQYNERAELTEEYSLKLPYIVIVIDELADLMMMASSEVQDYIVRITQKARAAGIHLLIATQRPSVDIVTGTIKNNIPTRVAFMVSSQVDSRTIIDTSGAERLLGKGDMLFLGNGASQPVRLQGTFVDDEVDRVTDFVRTQGNPHYEFDPDGLLAKEQSQQNEDELMPEVLDYIVQEQTVSTSKLQRVFSIGYNRAANMIDALENKQYISGQNGSKPRDVFLTAKQLTEMRGPRTD